MLKYEELPSWILNLEEDDIKFIKKFIMSSGSVLVADAITNKSFKFSKEKIAQALIVGGLTSTGALVTGLVSSSGGSVNNSVNDKYYPKQKKHK